jgi:hypothetical protein
MSTFERPLAVWNARLRSAVRRLHAAEQHSATRLPIVDAFLAELESCEAALRDVVRCLAARAESGEDCEAESRVVSYVYESATDFAEEVHDILTNEDDEDTAILPDVIALARVERESLAEDVRRFAASSESTRIRTCFAALAIALVTERSVRIRRAA